MCCNHAHLIVSPILNYCHCTCPSHVALLYQHQSDHVHVYYFPLENFKGYNNSRYDIEFNGRFESSSSYIPATVLYMYSTGTLNNSFVACNKLSFTAYVLKHILMYPQPQPRQPVCFGSPLKSTVTNHYKLLLCQAIVSLVCSWVGLLGMVALGGSCNHLKSPPPPSPALELVIGCLVIKRMRL